MILSEAVSTDPESVMSVLKRNRHSKRSSDSIYDLLHLVRSVLRLAFFLNHCLLLIRIGLWVSALVFVGVLWIVAVRTSDVWVF